MVPEQRHVEDSNHQSNRLASTPRPLHKGVTLPSGDWTVVLEKDLDPRIYRKRQFAIRTGKRLRVHHGTLCLVASCQAEVHGTNSGA